MTEVYRNESSQRKQNRMNGALGSRRRPQGVAMPGRENGGIEAARSALGTVANTVSTGSGGNRVRNRAKRPGIVEHKKRVVKTEEEMSAGRVRRFALQSEAARIVPEQRVSRCLRHMSPIASTVDVQHVPATSSAHYRHLQVCASVWACPICAATISERRRDELARLISQHTSVGGTVWMTTYTISHKRYDVLADLLSRFLAARRRMRQGRRGVQLRKVFGVVGTVSVLEVTWSEENGWHPHVHELVFAGKDFEMGAYEQEARSAWQDAAAALGLEMNRHGFQIDKTNGAVADYIAKYGREPAMDRPWGVESEMVKGHMKQGRRDEHYTPFAMLAAIHDAGRDELKPKFAEYARTFKGRKQLNYSPGLKALYQEEEKTDEELLAEHEHEAVTLLELQPEQWTQVLGNDIRAELLEEARSGRPGQVLSYLEDFGIATYPEQYERFAGWEVRCPDGPARVLSVTRCPVLDRWRCSVQLATAVNGSTWRAFDLSEIAVCAEPAHGGAVPGSVAAEDAG